MKKEKIVYTYGVFDLFHGGHIELLKEAKELGDKLVVGIFSDEVAESFKRKPIINLQERMKIVANSRYVDEVVSQDEFLPDKNLLKIKPDILAKGEGAGWVEGKEIPGDKTMKMLGGRIVMLKYHPGISTSQIIKICQERRNIIC